jgi:agmatinase
MSRDREASFDRCGDIVGQTAFSASPRYAGPPTFAGLPRPDQVSRHDTAIVGVPFDSGVTFRPGARFGPQQIRMASRLLRPYNPDLGAMPFAHQQVVDAGDIGVTPFDIEGAVSALEQAARVLLDSASRLLVLGGDHTIALPMLRTVAAKHGPIAVLHFDAHLDTFGDYFGASVHHGSPFRRAAEEGLLDQSSCAHIGIRGPLYGEHDELDDAEMGFAVTRCESIQLHGLAHAIEGTRKRLGDRPVYISVDVDVLDPAFAPGTGTPEAGGMSSREVLSFLRSLKGLNVVGADIVEVSPPYDHADTTALAAAHIAYEILSLWSLEGVGEPGGAPASPSPAKGHPM